MEAVKKYSCCGALDSKVPGICLPLCGSFLVLWEMLEIANVDYLEEKTQAVLHDLHGGVNL